jgi:hypothetical protein
MKIRIIFECSCCGSTSYRPSRKWTFKDNLLRRLGITPQRCFRCRRRFYIYDTPILRKFLNALAGPPEAAPEVEMAQQQMITHPPVKTDVVWSTFAEADQHKRRL